MARYARRGSSLILTSGPPTAASIRFSPLRDLRTDTPVTVGAVVTGPSATGAMGTAGSGGGIGVWGRGLVFAPPPGGVRGGKLFLQLPPHTVAVSAPRPQPPRR